MKFISKYRVQLILSILILLCLGILIFSGVQLYRIYSDYSKADKIYEDLLVYKPQDTLPIENDYLNAQSGPISYAISENSSIIQLKEAYPDVVGWITIDGTEIDYPFTQSNDNSKYLRTNLDGEYLVSGTLFLDYRCDNALVGSNSIIYGHKMKNNTMFSDLSKYAEKNFFNENSSGTLYLPYATYSLEVISYLVVDSADEIIYDPFVETSVYMDYIQKFARQSKTLEIKENDALLTLSTCSYEYDEARSVLVLKITTVGNPSIMPSE